MSQASIFCHWPIADWVARTCPVDLLVHGKGVGDLAERGRKWGPVIREAQAILS